jgi:hypothetical protein
VSRPADPKQQRKRLPERGQEIHLVMWICSTSQERELGLNKAGMRDDDSPTLLKFPEYDRSCANSFPSFGVHCPPIERDGYIGCYHLDLDPVRRKVAHFIGTGITLYDRSRSNLPIP